MKKSYTYAKNARVLHCHYEDCRCFQLTDKKPSCYDNGRCSDSPAIVIGVHELLLMVGKNKLRQLMKLTEDLTSEIPTEPTIEKSGPEPVL
jgi:hypothetical protein